MGKDIENLERESAKERMVYTQPDLLVKELKNQYKDISQNCKNVVNGMLM